VSGDTGRETPKDWALAFMQWLFGERELEEHCNAGPENPVSAEEMDRLIREEL
jgi:hypothetical protein